MRFLFHDLSILKLTFQVLLVGCRLSNHSPADRQKMETTLELLINKFFKLDFNSIISRSKNLNGINEDDLNLILGNTVEYYNAK